MSSKLQIKAREWDVAFIFLTETYLYNSLRLFTFSRTNRADIQNVRSSNLNGDQYQRFFFRNFVEVKVLPSTFHQSSSLICQKITVRLRVKVSALSRFSFVNAAFVSFISLSFDCRTPDLFLDWEADLAYYLQTFKKSSTVIPSHLFVLPFCPIICSLLRKLRILAYLSTKAKPCDFDVLKIAVINLSGAPILIFFNHNFFSSDQIRRKYRPAMLD